MFLLTLLFFLLADGLSTSRVDPSISISIHTEFKSFLRIGFYSSQIFISHSSHISASRCSKRLLYDDDGGLRVTSDRDQLPVLAVAALEGDNFSSTRVAHDMKYTLESVWWSDVACDVTAMSLSPDCLWTLCPIIRVAQCHLSAVPGQPAQQLFIQHN